MKPFNIVYLHTHDAGRYIQPYGYGIPTPHLQKFAEQGMLFRQAFCANPTCSPSRACLMTGQYAHVNGMLGLAHRGFAMNNYEHTLVNFIGQHGWHTALSGIQHIAHKDTTPLSAIGYREVLTESHDPEKVTEAAEAFLEQSHKQPFFLDVGYLPPHRHGPEGGFPKLLPAPNPAYVRPPAILPDTPAVRQDFAEYMASVASFDLMAGRVLDSLKQKGWAENTLVIITTDHGIAFPGMKCSLTDHGIGVFLLIRGPGGFSGGKVSDAMVSHLDIFPTICEILKLPIPEHIQGLSLLPLTKAPQARLRPEIFAEVNFHGASEPMRCIRTDRWKYIRRFHDYPRPILSNMDDGLSKTFLHQHEWTQHTVPQEELYDLVFDPNETCNLAQESDRTDTMEDLRSRLHQWMLETDDPCLNGKELNHTGKIVTPREAYSPSDAWRT